MANILILYSTTDGHTKKICQEIGTHLTSQGDFIQMRPVEKAESIDMDEYDKLVIGASIRYGKHNQNVYDFVANNKPMLNNKHNAFFSVNLVARKPEKRDPETNPYMRKFLKQIHWQPNQLAVFAGKLNYRKYGLLDRWMIRFIMFLTDGPTSLDTIEEFTDWQQVKQFAEQIHSA